MSRLIHFIARLYPRPWRERYGAEFSALLEDVGPDARTAANVLTGALAMQVRNWKSWKIFAVSAVFGVVVAAGLLSAIPNTYISTTIVKREGPASGQEAGDFINSILLRIESRGRLTEIITKYNLYLHERSKMPLDDVIDRMKRDIHTMPLGGVNIPAFRLQFTYTDPRVAQQVTRDITSRLLDESNRQPQSAVVLQILDEANFPKVPVYPNKPLLIGVGVTCLLLMWGGLSAWRSVSARRFAAVGPSISWDSSGGSSGKISGGGPVALSLPPFREHFRRNGWKIFTAFALLVAVALLTFRFANPSYESIAVIRILPPANGQESGDSIVPLVQSVESRSSLVRIISDYDLYRSEDYRLTLEQIIQRMKERIRIEPLGGNSGFAIRFAYSDRFVAQKVTQELASQFVEASSAGNSPVSLSVLDPASLPEPRFPIEPNYSVGLFFGLLLGVILSVTVVLFRRRPTLV